MPKTSTDSRPKPAPHVDIEGRVHRPVGTYGEMLQRAIEPKPKPLEWLHQQRLWATFRDNPHEVAYIVTTWLSGGEA